MWKGPQNIIFFIEKYMFGHFSIFLEGLLDQKFKYFKNLFLVGKSKL